MNTMRKRVFQSKLSKLTYLHTYIHTYISGNVFYFKFNGTLSVVVEVFLGSDTLSIKKALGVSERVGSSVGLRHFIVHSVLALNLNDNNQEFYLTRHYNPRLNECRYCGLFALKALTFIGMQKQIILNEIVRATVLLAAFLY